MINKPMNWQGGKKHETQEFERLTPGGYVFTIMNAIAHGDNCIRLSYDIKGGKFDGYFRKQYDQWGGTWRGTEYQAIMKKNGDPLPSFENFIYCVEASNRGYTWAWDEATLKGKLVGAVLREEEWINDQGEVKTSLKVDEWKTVADISNGNFKVREVKKVDKPQTQTIQLRPQVNNDNFNIDDSDIQF